MLKRMLIVVGAAVLFILALGAWKVLQIQGHMAMHASFAPPPEAVTSTVVGEESWSPVLSAIGSVVAVNGVTVSNDLPGIVEKISFESGKPAKKGDLLVKLDTRQEEAQLKAAIARQHLAKLSLDRQSNLRTKNVASQSDYDAASAEYLQAEAAVQEIRAIIERKHIRAPFDGLLGIREVNVGEYLQSGARIVPLESMDPIYVDFSLPQRNLGEISLGSQIVARADGLPGKEFTGQVTAINSVVDRDTRNFRSQATLRNTEALLRPGMFVDVEVQLPAREKVLIIPASSISYAPYGDSIFIIEEMQGPDGKAYKGVRQQFVKLGPSRGDQIAILTGLKPGEEVATSGIFKLRNGAAVAVDNSVQPGNDPAPAPEDT